MGRTETQARSHARRETRHSFCRRCACFRSWHKMLPRYPSAAAGADGEEASALAQVSTLKVLFRNLVLRTFVLPIDRQDPPAVPVVEKLNAVDPAHERHGIAWIVARLVCAPNMRDFAELFDSPRDFLFVESGFLESLLGSCDEAFDIQHLRRKSASRTDSSGGEIDIVPSVIDCRRDQTCAGNEKRSHAIPIALFSGRARDRIIRRGD